MKMLTMQNGEERSEIPVVFLPSREDKRPNAEIAEEFIKSILKEEIRHENHT